VGLADPTTITLFFNAVFCFFLVIVLNLLIGRILPKLARNAPMNYVGERSYPTHLNEESYGKPKRACKQYGLANYALNQGELLTIYSLLMVAVSVSWQDFTHTIFGNLGNARWFATPENKGAVLLLSYVPQRLEPSEKALEGYFSGEASFYLPRHLRGWMQPLLWWTLLLTVLCFVMLCINTLNE